LVPYRVPSDRIVVEIGEVIRKEDRNGESKDYEVCAHTVSV